MAAQCTLPWSALQAYDSAENCSGHRRLLRSNFSDSDSGARVCVRHSDCRTVQFLSCIEWYLWTSVSVFCYIFRLY